LLIQFLGQTAQEFFQNCFIEGESEEIVEPKPFGEGPWPCLNPICQYFQEPRINECVIKIIPNKAKQDKRINGTFECSCGFVYVRTGPDTSPNDQFRADRTKAYGEIWDEALRGMWKDSSLSTNAIAHRLDVYHNVVKSQAIRLGLQFPRQGGQGKGVRPTNVDPQILAKQEGKKIALQQKLEFCRTEWLRIRAENPSAVRRKLRYQPWWCRKLLRASFPVS